MTQMVNGNYGLIIDYDPIENTATVILSGQGSDQLGEILHNVYCPVHLGIQSVNPEKGRLCWVSFKDAAMAMPVINHFFSHVYSQVDFNRHNKAVVNTPRFIFSM